MVCFQLIHFLPDVGSHLSWLETEHTAGILMTATPHAPPSSSSALSTSLSLSLSHLHPPRFILSTHTLHSVCSTDFLSIPLFTLLISAPSRCSCTSSTQISLLLFSFHPSLHLTSLYLSPLLSLSLTGYIIQLHFFFFSPPIPSASPTFLCCSLSFSVGFLSSSFGHLPLPSSPVSFLASVN